MTTAQEVLANYKKLFINNTNLKQKDFKSMTLGNTEIKGSNILFNKEIFYTRTSGGGITPPLEPAVDNAFVFGFALFADLRVDLTTYDEFEVVDQTGSYTNFRTSMLTSGVTGLNTVRNLVYSDPDRRLVDKLITGTTGSLDISGLTDFEDLVVNSGTTGADPIFSTYAINGRFQSGCAYDEFTVSSSPIRKLTKIGFRLPQISDPDILAATITPIPPYTYDLIFSASNFYVVPYALVSSTPLSDGSPLIVIGSNAKRWDGEVYDTGNTLIRSWTSYNRDDDPNVNDSDAEEPKIYPSITLSSGEYDFDTRGFAISDMYDGEIRNVDYWWRYRRSGANWYDL